MSKPDMAAGSELSDPATPPGGPPSLARRVFSIDMVCGALVAGIALFMFAGVVSRYIFQVPLTWGEEFVRYSFTWLAFLSAALAMKYHGHSAIELLVDALPEGPRRLQRLFAELVVAVFLAIFIYYSTRMAMITHGQTSSALRIPMSWVYAAAPVSSAIMLFYSARNILNVLRERAAP